MPVEYSPSITSARIIPSLLRCPPERGKINLFQALVEPRNGEPFLVQQFIDMSHEYRVFVVDGRPVAGAPVLRSDCIHDPWLRGRFKPTVTPDRDADPAVEDRSCVAAYARLARRFAH